MHDILKTVFFAAAAFLTLYILARVLGKKQIAQLSFIDYAIGISLGSIAAEMAFDISDRPFYYYIIAMVVFFAFDLLLNILGQKAPFLKWLLNGRPIAIIYDGKIDYKALMKGGIDINELLSMLRVLGYFDIKQVAYAVLETSGQLSVMPIGAERPAVTRDLPIPVQDPSLPNYLIADGRISYSGLKEINKDTDWLIKKLNLNSKKELKQIILAVYDQLNDQIVTHRKVQ